MMECRWQQDPCHGAGSRHVSPDDGPGAPAGHNFCKGCLDKRFEGVCDTLPNNTSRSLRVRKVRTYGTCWLLWCQAPNCWD
jgi:hypothetical protein